MVSSGKEKKVMTKTEQVEVIKKKIKFERSEAIYRENPVVQTLLQKSCNDGVRR